MTARKQKATEPPSTASPSDSKRQRRSADDVDSSAPPLSQMTQRDKPFPSPTPSVSVSPDSPAEPSHDHDAPLDDDRENVLTRLVVRAPAQRPEPRMIEQEEAVLRPSELAYFPTELVDRIVSIMNFSEPSANRYNVGLLPLRASWGPVGDGSGLDRYLCYEQRPVTIWLVGIVTTTWLAPTEGSRVNIGLRLLSQRDIDVCKYIQYRMCSPHGDAANSGLTTFASRYLNTRSDDPEIAFTEVYDGCDRLAGWSCMNKIDEGRIQKTDMVLVEAYVKRFKHREPGNRFTWSSWGVSFELLRIALLYPGPGPADLMPGDSNVNI